MAYSDKFQYSDILLNKEKVYKPDFWSNYNIILPNEKYENLFKTANNINEEKIKTKQRKWLDFLLKTKQKILLSWSTLNTSSVNLTFQNPALDIQETLSASNKNVYGFLYSLFYEFKPNFFIGYTGESKISKNGIASHSISLQKQININPKKRPIFITPSIDFGYQELNCFLGNFNTTEKLYLNNKSLNKGKTSVFLSQRNFRCQPKIALTLEKNKRINFIVSLNYNLPISKKVGLLFQEKEGFFLFRKKTFVKNNNHNLNINHTNDLLGNGFSLNAGISIKL
ncbi:hypothetical protein [Seonamhaeicola sp. S2-3]|uniref:hypothetical protein n=1 Tax=Seonamhaeicola sp. S2-3 TaxID=1936081 RepID=UPI0018DC0D40|nr:hypothetical protein [Seonamhaeicola sp. S2-3]